MTHSSFGLFSNPFYRCMNTAPAPCSHITHNTHAHTETHARKRTHTYSYTHAHSENQDFHFSFSPSNKSKAALEHAATHCNTPQHNTLQHNAAHCNTHTPDQLCAPPLQSRKQQREWAMQSTRSSRHSFAAPFQPLVFVVFGFGLFCFVLLQGALPFVSAYARCIVSGVCM